MEEQDYWKHPIMWLLMAVMLLMVGLTYLQHLLWKWSMIEIFLPDSDPLNDWR